jgi:zinc transport system substrate-binding protein
MPWIRFVLALLLSSVLIGEDKPLILVSVPVYQNIVQEMVGEDVTVQSVVPAGISFHNFEPTIGQVTPLFQARLWFTIGETFEKKIVDAMYARDDYPLTVDLRHQLLLIGEDHDYPGATDPHIWTSPNMMKVQLKTICDGLVRVFPEKEKIITTKYQKLDEQCDTLIQDVDALLEFSYGKLIVIAHGAYGYLCRDYGLVQLSLEEGGKEPSIAKIFHITTQAKEHNVETVFSLKQYPKKGITTVAKVLNAKVVELDPYSMDYFVSVKETAQAFFNAAKEEI